MIELDRVTKRFGDTVAVTDVSFSVGHGEICVLIGPSGCGKTTTLKMINRVIEPSAGSIRVRGADVARTPAVALRRGIGYVIQHVGLFPHMTVAENVAIALRLRGADRARRRRRAAELLELVGLRPELLDRWPAQLSGGQQQRVGVARALAGEPDIVLMDEPFGAVDPLLRVQLQRELRSLQEKLRKTIVLVTHDLSEAFALADRIVLMREGRVVQQGAPRELVLAPGEGFVAEFLADVRVADLLRLTRLADLGPLRAGALAAGVAMPAERSVLDALRALATPRSPPVAGITVLGRDGVPAGSLDLDGFVRALAGIMARERP